MAEIVLDIRARAAVQQRPQPVEIAYLKAFEKTEGLPPSARDTVRITLDASLKGSVTLPDVAPGSTIELVFLADSGRPRLIRRATAPSGDDQVDVELSAADTAALAEADPLPTEPAAAGPATVVARAGRFVPVGDAPVDFATARLEVAPLTLATDWQAAGLDALFGSRTPAATTTAMAVELAVPWSGYGSLSWTPSRLGADGAFAAEFAEGTYDAWVWWLSGSRSALGIVPDDLSKPASRRFALALPPFAEVAEVAEDPERVLGERRFNVVLRVEQPSADPDPTLRGSGLLVLDPEIRDVSPGRPARFVDSPWPSADEAAAITRGHILEYALRWRSDGHSPGTVASTLTLAPGRSKRIRKVLRDREAASGTVIGERDYEDEVRASLDAWARGAVAGEADGTVGPFLIGGGGGHSTASSGSAQDDGPRAVADEERRLRETTRCVAESLRRAESAVVVSEVGREEAVTGTTEVVRNDDHGHALTVIHHRILRRLRVETVFTGVRECVFVPFAVSPFTLLRAYRWRESIRAGLRDQRHARALAHLDDVVTGFSQSGIPAGRRCDQPVRHIAGSLFLTLAEERPDRQLPREDASRIAAGWVDGLRLSASGQSLRADFGLASGRQCDGQVRVDFSVPVPAGQRVTRELLSSWRVLATGDLPPGSVAHLTRMSFEYQTDTFRHSVGVSPGTPDLVTVESGLLDPSGAVVSAPPDPWEREDEQLALSRAAQELVQHLNEHVEHYHKAIWSHMDRDRLLTLLDGFHLPSAPAVSVAAVVDHDPVAIVGNSLVFRVTAGSFLGLGGTDTPEALHRYYATGYSAQQPLHISLPTDGLYAQTITTAEA
ncbi:hypothetical protein ACWDYJ_16910 [Streptomyces sp. NPDC003042]